MACTIADNRPLKNLSAHLGVPLSCHSPKAREFCVHNLPDNPNILKGVQESALGYCNGLFNYQGSPAFHTLEVMGALRSIGVPMPHSHEVYWGHKPSGYGTINFFDEIVVPLHAHHGRVPVIITGLDPLADAAEVHELFNAAPEVWNVDTVLVRLLVNSASVAATASLLQNLLAKCHADQRMPKFWPLLQSGSMTADDWEELLRQAGGAAPYINVAVNPFTSLEVHKAVRGNITVAQLPIGLADGVTGESVRLAPGMKITGAGEAGQYNVMEYFVRLAELHGDVPPTLIVLGPSQPQWTVEMNRQRIAKFLPLLYQGLEELWQVSASVREELLALPA